MPRTAFGRKTPGMPTGLVSLKIEAPRRVQPFRKKGLDIFEVLRHPTKPKKWRRIFWEIFLPKGKSAASLPACGSSKSGRQVFIRKRKEAYGVARKKIARK